MPSSVRAPVIDVGVTLLKAPSMSRNAAREYSLLQNTREWRAVSVDLPLRYAYKAAVEEGWLGIYLVSVVAQPGRTRPGRGSEGLKRVNGPLNAVRVRDVVYALVVKALLYVDVLHFLVVLREVGV